MEYKGNDPEVKAMLKAFEKSFGPLNAAYAQRAEIIASQEAVGKAREEVVFNSVGASATQSADEHRLSRDEATKEKIRLDAEQERLESALKTLDFKIQSLERDKVSRSFSLLQSLRSRGLYEIEFRGVRQLVPRDEYLHKSQF